MIYKREIRKLGVTGNADTYFVTIPRWMVEGLGWRKGQKVEIRVVGKRVILMDWKPEKRLRVRSA